MEDTDANAMSRRDFLHLAAASGLLAAAGGLAWPDTARAEAFVMPSLPYPENALEPVISARTMSFHYGKHTAAYFENANKLAAASPLAGKPLEEVFLEAAKDPKLTGLYNNAAQAWNHAFYWSGLKPGGGGRPAGKLAAMLDAGFGSYEGFVKAMTEAAGSQFGSGWAWLVSDGKALSVVKTGNAGNPMQEGLTPLLTIDVWEHAYYLDYQNRRADYVKGVIEKLLNWEFAAGNLR